ncbi:hypothetical protein TSAR_008571 [Trichomalopsis sarcophagae]|uniref:Uncharacterized protein n=1 Tax=Trichomalopsis sarcophagae TaxID=543379 RepID=A0A232EG93_9HYME|nr:hypothetical protein TSAR_008571 [Trichomalopsis sarcophagae]
MVHWCLDDTKIWFTTESGFKRKIGIRSLV